MPSRAWAMTALLIVLTGTSVAAAEKGGNAGQGNLPNGRPFVALRAEIATLKGQIDELVASNASQTELISALGGVILAMEARLAGMQATVEEMQAHDALYDQWLEALDARWHTAEAQLAGYHTDLQRLYDADQALQELVYALQLRVNNLQDRLATLGDGMSALQSSLLSDLAATNAALAALRAELDGKQAALTQSCPVGSSIRQISATAGTVVCELDDVSSGTGGSVGRLEQSDFSATFSTVGPGDTVSSRQFCPSGWVATGGGYHKDLPGEVIIVGPTTGSAGSGWQAAVQNLTTTPTVVRAFARCMRVVP